jgi:hypothetical protein
MARREKPTRYGCIVKQAVDLRTSPKLGSFTQSIQSSSDAWPRIVRDFRTGVPRATAPTTLPSLQMHVACAPLVFRRTGSEVHTSIDFPSIDFREENNQRRRHAGRPMESAVLCALPCPSDIWLRGDLHADGPSSQSENPQLIQRRPQQRAQVCPKFYRTAHENMVSY